MDPKTIGRYEIVDELGRGAMGSVFRARDPAMGRIVALKCILSAALAGDQTNEFRERFYREARAAGALAHPGIVPVFDVGEDNGVPYLVMELVQGRTLDSALKQGERYSLERVCEIGQHLAEAMGYAHRNGVVHRDIKPANILMTSKEVYGAERPRITDFGVAKLAGGEMTSTGQLLGTPAFMPPEQFTGAPIDGRTDLFALGVILYRMTTGEQPFPGETLTAVSYKVVHTEPIAPSKLNPAIPRQLEAVILKCLAKSPMERYQTGEDLAADLNAVRTGAPAAGVSAASGAQATLVQGTLARAGAGETIDQVASLRPRQAAPPPVPAEPDAPTYVSGTQSRPFAPPAAPRPAAPPEQAFSTGTQSRPYAQPIPPAPPRPVAPPVATPPQSYAPPAQPRPPVQPPPRPSAPPATSFAPQARPAAPPPQPLGPAAAPSSVHSTLNAIPAAHPDAGSTLTRVVTAKKEAAETRQPPPRKRGVPVLLWVVILALGVVGSRYLMRLKIQPTTQEIVSDGSSPAAPAAAQPVEPQDVGGGATTTAGTSTGAVSFNPRTLDPDSNSHLDLKLDHFPTPLIVTVQMDGKLYWSGSAGDEGSYQGLLVPPGKHQFRAVVNGEGAVKVSNSVSSEFLARQHMALTLRLTPEPRNMSSAVLSPATQVVASLQKGVAL